VDKDILSLKQEDQMRTSYMGVEDKRKIMKGMTQGHASS
jgi:hypothetical protein